MVHLFKIRAYVFPYPSAGCVREYSPRSSCSLSSLR